MNCKFHTDKESVTKCAVCGAEMCSECKEHPYYRDDKDEPCCLDCSLKLAESWLKNEKEIHNFIKIRGIIASVIWSIGLGLFGIFGENFAPIAIVLMIGAVIFFLISLGKEFFIAVFGSCDFYGKIKTFLLMALLCPFYVIFILIVKKLDINKANKEVQKIKSDLNTN